MNSLKASHLLVKAAHWYQKEREVFSKAEISARLTEIKYLSSQKKVPKLTLRKEIVHLEHQLKSVYDLEKRLLQKEKRESTKVAALKRQIALLKQKLVGVEDQDVQSKIDKVTFLIGDCLAKKEVKEDIDLCQKVAANLEKQKLRVVSLKNQENHISPMPTPNSVVPTEEIGINTTLRVREMMQRLEALRDELELQQQMDHIDTKQMRQLEQKIALVEGKLRASYSPSSTSTSSPKQSIAGPQVIREENPRHIILLAPAAPAVSPKQSAEVKPAHQLPLPPPPKM
ncbi:TPA: hypothetical protein HA242_00540 [Candidatus Woesearchaeota archaeon]|nr:hypothetical protein [Candidatus Woesearchaeota archaeon]